MELHIFEDQKRSDLYPLNLFRGTEDLRCGILTLKEKAQIGFSKYFKSGTGDPLVLFLNSRVIAYDRLFSEFVRSKEECLFIQDDILVAALLSKKKSKVLSSNKIVSFEDFMDLKKKKIKAELVCYPWDLIHKNAKEIQADIERLGLKTVPKKFPGVSLVNKSRVFLSKTCSLKPGVVLDAEDGPIVIDDDAKIMANSVIIGPAYIGKNSTIKALTKIYGGTSIGPMCKVGGEVEGSIFQGYSNKQHDGFLGHSFICEWVNLGADTNNSDLKNNYGNVKVYVNGKIVDSGHMFVGLIMGDHSKSGINTMFNTGTVVGVSSNIFGAGFPPKFVPSFSWGGAQGFAEYDIEKALDVARRVMKRRDVVMTKGYEKLFRKTFEETRQERKSLSI